jgi:hypothetical protein
LNRQATDRLSLQPQPGKWSIKDNVAHLAKYQPIFIDRVHRILLGGEPAFESYRAENDTEFAAWQSWEIQTLLDRLHADREQIKALVTDLSYTQLDMIGVHKKFGRLTIGQWTEFFFCMRHIICLPFFNYRTIQNYSFVNERPIKHTDRCGSSSSCTG